MNKVVKSLEILILLFFFGCNLASIYAPTYNFQLPTLQPFDQFLSILKGGGFWGPCSTFSFLTLLILRPLCSSLGPFDARNSHKAS
jgi:hypothetical protein